jgi:probable F420-dependent oxidoreductase
MRLDHYLTPGPLGGVADEVSRAVRLGFDGVMAAETSHDPFLALTAAAGAAPGLDIGTAIAVAFARSPMTVAHAAWDLADVSGGRFLLGLGTQIRAHVVGRFSMPWTAPVSRMREFIAALRAIWASWQEGEPLRFRGDHYRFSLMTPFFNPGPIEHPAVPILLAAVGPSMCRLVGEAADGIHVHPFHTRRYLDEVVRPAIASGATRTGRDPGSSITVANLFVVTGRDDEEMARSAAAARRQIAFYASTPAYRGVLDLHGWDVGDELNALSKQGRWDEMGSLIDDEMLREVAVVAPPEQVAASISERCQGSVDRLGFVLADGLSDGDLAGLVSALSS